MSRDKALKIAKNWHETSAPARDSNVRELYERQYGHLKDEKPIKVSRGTPVFYTPKQVADMLQVSLWYVYNAMYQKQLRAQPLGRHKRIMLDDLNDFLISQRQKAL